MARLRQNETPVQVAVHICVSHPEELSCKISSRREIYTKLTAPLYQKQP